MDENLKNDHQMDIQELRQYYSAILNSMPYLVYWVDENCRLQGCNVHFSRLLGLTNIHDFTGNPYEKLAKATQWTAEASEAYRLDDMAVIFSGKPEHEKTLHPIVQSDGTFRYYVCNRDPLLNTSGQVIGAVIVMIEVTEQRLHEQRFIREAAQIIDLPAVSKGGAPRVLIVEDNFVAKQVEEALLLALKCEVDTAATGGQALILFEPGKYDLVVMDIGLEDTSGYVLSKQFRQMEKNSNFHVPIIALTSFQADLVKYDCDYYFMDGVISKPLTAEQADQIVQHYVYRNNTAVTGLKQA